MAGVPGTPGSSDGTALLARLNNPQAVSFASNGDAYIAEFNNCLVRRLDAATGNVITVAGSACGSALDGTVAAARFSNLRGVAFVASTGARWAPRI